MMNVAYSVQARKSPGVNAYQLFRRELRLRRGSGATAIVPAAVTAFVTALPPEPALLQAAAPGVLLSVGVLATLIGSEKMFADDLRSGAVLRLLAQSDAETLVAVKALAHWVRTLPALAAVLPCALLLHVPAEALGPAAAALLCVSAGFSALLAVPAAAGATGAMSAAALLPLPIPLLIFGSATAGVHTDPATLRQAAAFLAALTLALPVITIKLAAGALRRSIADV